MADSYNIKVSSKSMLLETQNKYLTKNLHLVVKEPALIPSNIISGQTILGVQGSIAKMSIMNASTSTNGIQITSNTAAGYYPETIKLSLLNIPKGQSINISATGVYDNEINIYNKNGVYYITPYYEQYDCGYSMTIPTFKLTMPVLSSSGEVTSWKTYTMPNDLTPPTMSLLNVSTGSDDYAVQITSGAGYYPEAIKLSKIVVANGKDLGISMTGLADFRISRSAGYIDFTPDGYQCDSSITNTPDIPVKAFKDGNVFSYVIPRDLCETYTKTISATSAAASRSPTITLSLKAIRNIDTKKENTNKKYFPGIVIGSITCNYTDSSIVNFASGYTFSGTWYDGHPDAKVSGSEINYIST